VASWWKFAATKEVTIFIIWEFCNITVTYL